MKDNPSTNDRLFAPRDWCISRQLWWGQRIPAYFCRDSASGKEFVVVASTDEEARREIETKGFDPNDVEAKRDEDVFDTWFSSALVPFANFGWPEQIEEVRPVQVFFN